MLSAPQVQRFVRHILIPEVGRAGQERWSASRVSVSGAGPALDAAVELLSAAGVSIDLAPPAAHAVLAMVGSLRLSETALADVRAACGDCLAIFFKSQPSAPPDEWAATAFAAGAAAAGEALLHLLNPERPAIAMAFTPEPRRVSVARSDCVCRLEQARP